MINNTGEFLDLLIDEIEQEIKEEEMEKPLFRILGSNRGVNQDPHGIYGRSSYLNGKETFKRIFIQRIKPEEA
jgi:hypothetical protein